MTSLIAWLGVDSRGPSSFYLASDSRITWRNGVGSWDSGQKLFCGVGYPDLFGYAGDVLFPFTFLSQATRLLPACTSSGALLSPQERHAAFREMATEAFALYPSERRGAFSFLHCGRKSSGMSTRFHLWHTAWDHDSDWTDVEVAMPSSSSLVAAIGSGRSSVSAETRKWQDTESGGTSRAVFSAFCDALGSNLDPHTGGSPQLVGLYRQDNGRHFGVIHNERRFVSGLPVGIAAAERIEWRNSLFECCDPRSMAPLEGAQRQPRPRTLRGG
jgi:hypothetical protein